MHVGMEILGAIKKISELGVSIDLPSGLSGFVAITEISEPLTKEVQQAMADDEHKGKGKGDDDEDDTQVTAPTHLLSLTGGFRPSSLSLTTTNPKNEQSLHFKDVKVPDLHDIFTVGQIVRVQVITLPDEGKMANKKKTAKIELTMNPQRINRSLKAADLEPGIVWSPQTDENFFVSMS